MRSRTMWGIGLALAGTLAVSPIALAQGGSSSSTGAAGGDGRGGTYGASSGNILSDDGAPVLTAPNAPQPKVRAKQRSLEGTAVDVSADGFTLLGSGGAKRDVTADPETPLFEGDRKIGSLADVPEGAPVRASFSGDGELMELELLPARTP